jgi:hypothetical protein
MSAAIEAVESELIQEGVDEDIEIDSLLTVCPGTKRTKTNEDDDANAHNLEPSWTKTV